MFFQSLIDTLTQGKFAIVDDEDFHYLSRFEWHAAINSNNDYAARRRAKLDELIQEAISNYLALQTRKLPKSVGMGAR